jgi:DMSO/TMAO reductase YedYZ molybdopterin-dependent catalytic subunit
MSPASKPQRSAPPITRRSLLEWLGGGCVLALSGAALAACESGPGVTPDTGPGAGDGPLPGRDALAPDRGDADGPAGGSFPFSPGSGTQDVFKGWPERTVDPQDLKKILAGWRLRVDGLVESPRTYTFADLVKLKRSDMLVDFHCVEGWTVQDVPWNGVHLSEIFNQVKPKASATHVAFHTVGGDYNESLPLAIAKEPRTILGYGVADHTLPLNHGFPLRVVIPRLLGYKNAKYVERVELTDKRLLGYWVKLGYSYDGQVPASRLRPGKY